MTDVLNVTKRDQLGTSRSRRLRQGGQIPAVLYGHGEANVSLSIPAIELEQAIRQGVQMVDIRGAVHESALIREVQWDALGAEVIHVDLTRVSADEAVEVTVQVELRGEAPGSKEGGVVEVVTHELEIRCPARSIPEGIEITINEMHLGDSIKAGDIVPEGSQLIGDPEQVVVQCIEPLVEPEEEEEEVAPMEGLEPEIIGRKEEEEEEGD